MKEKLFDEQIHTVSTIDSFKPNVVICDISCTLMDGNENCDWSDFDKDHGSVPGPKCPRHNKPAGESTVVARYYERGE